MLWERAGELPMEIQILRRSWSWIGQTSRKPAPQGKRKRGCPRISWKGMWNLKWGRGWHLEYTRKACPGQKPMVFKSWTGQCLAYAPVVAKGQINVITWSACNVSLLKWYYDKKSFPFFLRFWKRIRLTSNWQNFELCIYPKAVYFECKFWICRSAITHGQKWPIGHHEG